MGMARSRFVAQSGMIAAGYGAATLIAILFLQGLAWGPIQFRISEALTVLALFTPAAIPGLTIGCALANCFSLAITGTGALGLLDVVFGSLATCIGSLWCWKFRSRPLLALLGPVLANALIVPAYLPILLQGLGFETIPLTDLSLSGAYLPLYLFGVATTGFGQFVVVYGIGFPITKLMQKAGHRSRV